jgi:hypothetical protein
MLYLAEPTAATLKGCGYELQQHRQQHREKTKKNKNIREGLV